MNVVQESQWDVVLRSSSASFLRRMSLFVAKARHSSPNPRICSTACFYSHWWLSIWLSRNHCQHQQSGYSPGREYQRILGAPDLKGAINYVKLYISLKVRFAAPCSWPLLGWSPGGQSHSPSSVLVRGFFLDNAWSFHIQHAARGSHASRGENAWLPRANRNGSFPAFSGHETTFGLSCAAIFFPFGPCCQTHFPSSTCEV